MSLLGGIGGNLLPPVVMSIIADATGVKAGIGEATKEMGAFEAGVQKAAGVGMIGLAGIALGATAAAAESVKMAMSFDQTMEMIRTQAGDTKDNINDLSNAVLNMAPAVGQSPEALATALYHITSTGKTGAEALDILQQSAKLASIGMANLDDVTYAMSGVMSVGMKDIGNASDAIAFMNATVGMGDMRMQDLARAIGTGILPAFKSAGLGMVDFSAAIATLTDNSVPADEAATRLRMTISLMAAPSGKAADALASIGMTSTQMAEDLQQPNGLLVAVQDLKYHLNLATGAANYAGMTLEQKAGDVQDFAQALKDAGASSDEIAAKTKLFSDQLDQTGDTAVRQNQVIEKAFGGGKTSGAIQTLLTETVKNANGDDILKLQSKYDQMGDAGKRAADMQSAWADQQKQFTQQWHDLTAEVEKFGIKIGNFLIPKIQDVIGFFERHKQLAKDIAIAIAVVTYLLGGLAIAMWIVTLNPVGLIIGLIVIAVGLLIVGILELVQHWSTVWGFIKKIAGDVADWFMRYVWHDGIEKFINWVKDIPHMVMDALRFLAHAFADPWIAAFNFVADAWNSTIGKLTWTVPSWVPLIGGNTISVPQLPHVSLSFDEGGIVPGPPGKAWPAIVHGGEGVLTADQMQALTRAANGGGWSGGGDIVIHNHTYVDGREVRTSILRVARGKAQSASTMYPQTTGMLP